MFEIGDVVWYKTGIFSASKVEILATSGSGATLNYIVRFIDTAPDQWPSLEENVGRWDKGNPGDYVGGGVPIASKKCVALTEDEKHLMKVQRRLVGE
jgi:hypothetical protein